MCHAASEPCLLPPEASATPSPQQPRNDVWLILGGRARGGHCSWVGKCSACPCDTAFPFIVPQGLQTGSHMCSALQRRRPTGGQKGQRSWCQFCGVFSWRISEKHLRHTTVEATVVIGCTREGNEHRCRERMCFPLPSEQSPPQKCPHHGVTSASLEVWGCPHPGRALVTADLLGLLQDGRPG